MTESKKKPAEPNVAPMILTIRDKKVILDADLAELYGVETKALNQAVKRNSAKFPEDFSFLLTREETEGLSSQLVVDEDDKINQSQIVTGSQKHRDPKYAPRVFTEHGAIMAANVIRSPKAVEMSVFIVRAFVKMREQLLATAALEKRLAEVEKILLTHDSTIRELYDKIRPLLLPLEEPGKKPIGFHVKEKKKKYRTKDKRK